jgi:integrase
LYRLGVPDKIIQAILRHSNLTTTMNVYVKTVDQDSFKAMKALETLLTAGDVDGIGREPATVN